MKNIAILVLLSTNSFFIPTLVGSQNVSKPNIVFIMADDLGSSELGCYGNTFNETPQLDKLASEGLKFTQAYAAAPICSPTRASIMTGQYPARVKITDFLPDNSPRYLDPAKYYTINEALSDAGYRSVIIGKWHLDTDFKNPKGSPSQNGFDEVIGSETKYIADGDYFYPYDKINTFQSGSPGEYLTDRQCEEASKFIERNKERPFFMYLTFYSVHTRLDAPENLVNKYKQKFDLKYGQGMADKIYGGDNPRKEGNHKDNPYLAAMIERIDKGVGKILETLKENGLDKNTVVIFFSDNGGVSNFANNGILRAGKSWLYEGGIRENLIIKWPYKIKAGTVTNLPVTSIDFYPTFLDIAGIRNKSGNLLDGKSIFKLLDSNCTSREAFFWHFPSETAHWKNRMCSAIRYGDFKLLHFYDGNRLELYNLKSDPSERNDISSRNPVKANELKKKLDYWRADVNAEKPDLNWILGN